MDPHHRSLSEPVGISYGGHPAHTELVEQGEAAEAGRADRDHRPTRASVRSDAIRRRRAVGRSACARSEQAAPAIERLIEARLRAR